MAKREKDLLVLRDLLSKGGPRVRTTGCEKNGHKPVYVTYGFPPRKIKTDESKK